MTTSTAPTYIRENAICNAIKDSWIEFVAPRVTPNSCVLAAKVVSEVLKRLGLSAFVVPMKAMAVNDVMLDHQLNNVHYAQWSEDAWSVGVGYEKTDASRVDNRLGAGFDGHLIVSTSTHFVDLTAGQFDRPAKGIDTGGPIVVPLDSLDFAFSFPVDPASRFIYRELNEGHILYEQSEDYSYEKSRDWTINYLYFADKVHSYVKFACGDFL